MRSSEFVVLEGFHGTSLERAEAILARGYHCVSSPEDWLGSGVYFFLDGFSCAVNSASEWAFGKYADEKCAVVKSRIECKSSNVLDLTTLAGLRKYNDARGLVLERFGDALKERRDLSVKKRKDIRLDDKIITDLIFVELGFEILIHNVYIKNRRQRALELESSYPNSTVCSVGNLKCIVESSIINI